MTIDFCKNWTYQKDGSPPVEVNLPHDAMIFETRDAGCQNGVNTGYFPGGKYIYEKTFELDATIIGKSVMLHLEEYTRTVKYTRMEGSPVHIGMDILHLIRISPILCRLVKTPSVWRWTTL